ncbi:hypothetical protein AAMO2058_000386900 [Amorphochlora amoebiformis]|mmetsp:Transcript_25486/g.40247  ORF Transcript_25486/g.40247 Transcript_25486/m.40247 type:complete len:409 (-) Transcript_25486:104-1330(-)
MLSIFALRHGAAKVTSIDKNQDMVDMCFEAVELARKSCSGGNKWGIHDAFHGTFPTSTRVSGSRSAGWLADGESGKTRKFDILISEILGTLATSESMWDYVLSAKPYLNTFLRPISSAAGSTENRRAREEKKEENCGNKISGDDFRQFSEAKNTEEFIYCIPSSISVTGAFYDMSKLFASESTGQNYPLKLALDTGAYGLWKSSQASMTLTPKSHSDASQKYVSTGEAGLYLYDMGFNLATNKVEIVREVYSKVPFSQWKLSESRKRKRTKKKNTPSGSLTSTPDECRIFEFREGCLPGPRTFFVLEWEAVLWQDVQLANTLELYKSLDSRNKAAKNLNWGFFCSRPWTKTEPQLQKIEMRVLKWDAGVPYLRFVKILPSGAKVRSSKKGKKVKIGTPGSASSRPSSH